MKTFPLFLLFGAFLAAACTPDPLPELREQIHGRWNLRASGHVSYSPIFAYSFNYPANNPYQAWTIDFATDGTALIENDSSYQTTWQHVDRDNIKIKIPAGIFLPQLGSWECSLSKYQNEYDRQYLMGGGTYFTDTAVVSNIHIEMFWDLERLP